MAGIPNGDAEGDKAEWSVADQAERTVLAQEGALLGRPDFSGFIPN